MCSIKKIFKYSQSRILIKRSGTVQYSDGGVYDMGERELTNLVCSKREIDPRFGVSLGAHHPAYCPVERSIDGII